MGEQQQQRPRHELAVLSAKEGFLAVMKNPDLWMKEAAFALQAVAESQYLQKCTPDSIRKAVAGVALTGTTLNPVHKLAYLIPRQDHGVWKACLQFSYRGSIKTVVDGGSIRGVRAVVVYDFDFFDYNMGTPAFVKHKHGEPKADGKVIEDFEDRPELILKHFTHCFSIATFVDGTEEILVLPRWKILKNMKASAQYRTAAAKMARGEKGSGIHDNWMEEMLRKTQILYHCKSLPISEQARHMMEFANEAIREPEGDGGGSFPKDAAKDLMDRFNFSAEDIAGGYSEEEQVRPDTCPECGKLRVEGRCHNQVCPAGEPAE